jgi:hypothetical protein
MALEFWFDNNPIPDMQNTEWLKAASVKRHGGVMPMELKVTLRVDTAGISDALLPFDNSSIPEGIVTAISGIGAAAAVAATAIQRFNDTAATMTLESILDSDPSFNGHGTAMKSAAQAVADTASISSSFEDQDMPPPKPSPLGFVYVGNDTWLPKKLHTKRRRVQRQEVSRPHRPLWPGAKPRPPRYHARRER